MTCFGGKFAGNVGLHRESNLVMAGHVSKHANASRTEGWVLNLILSTLYREVSVALQCILQCATDVVVKLFTKFTLQENRMTAKLSTG